MKVDEDMWDLGHHRWEATRMQNLHNIELGSVEEAPAPRTGKVGYLDHPRLAVGLIGSVAYWVRGGMAHAVTMTVKLGITERVRNALPKTQTTRDAETNAKIVDLLKAGLAKTCKDTARDNGREERIMEIMRTREREQARETEEKVREKEGREKESENMHIYMVYIINCMCTCIYVSVCIYVYLGICVCVYTYEFKSQIHNVHIYMCTYIHIYINMFHIWVDQRGETLASRSSLALSVWRCM